VINLRIGHYYQEAAQGEMELVHMGQSPAGGGADPPRDFAVIFAQLAERMGEVGKASFGLSGATATDPTAAWRQWLSQPSVSVTQLRATLDDLKARRDQIQSLTVQLQAFDEQLAALETALIPLVEWSASWDQLRLAMLDPLGTSQRQQPPNETK
jgi:hypothetical protein